MGFENTGYGRDLFGHQIPKLLKLLEDKNKLKKEEIEAMKEMFQRTSELNDSVIRLTEQLRWIR